MQGSLIQHKLIRLNATKKNNTAPDPKWNLGRCAKVSVLLTQEQGLLLHHHEHRSGHSGQRGYEKENCGTHNLYEVRIGLVRLFATWDGVLFGLFGGVDRRPRLTRLFVEWIIFDRDFPVRLGVVFPVVLRFL